MQALMQSARRLSNPCTRQPQASAPASAEGGPSAEGLLAEGLLAEGEPSPVQLLPEEEQQAESMAMERSTHGLTAILEHSAQATTAYLDTSAQDHTAHVDHSVQEPTTYMDRTAEPTVYMDRGMATYLERSTQEPTVYADRSAQGQEPAQREGSFRERSFREGSFREGSDVHDTTFYLEASATSLKGAASPCDAKQKLLSDEAAKPEAAANDAALDSVEAAADAGLPEDPLLPRGQSGGGPPPGRSEQAGSTREAKLVSPKGLPAAAPSWRRPAAAVLLGAVVLTGVVALVVNRSNSSIDKAAGDVMMAVASAGGLLTTTTNTSTATLTTASATVTFSSATTTALSITSTATKTSRSATDLTATTATSMSSGTKTTTKTKSSTTTTRTSTKTTTNTTTTTKSTRSTTTTTTTRTLTPTTLTTVITATTATTETTATTLTSVTTIQTTITSTTAVTSVSSLQLAFGDVVAEDLHTPVHLSDAESSKMTMDTHASEATPALLGSSQPAPVAEATPAAVDTHPGLAHLLSEAHAGDTVLQVDSQEGFNVGDQVEIASDGASERKVISSFGTIVLDEALASGYPTGASVTKVADAEQLAIERQMQEEEARQLEEEAAQQAADAKHKRDAIIGGVVGGTVGVAGLVTGLAVGLTQKKLTTTTTFLSPTETWTQLTSTTGDAVAFVSDGHVSSGLHATLGAGNPTHSSAAADLSQPSEIWWALVALVLLLTFACALFAFFRRKLLNAGLRKEARSFGDWSPSTEGSASCASPSYVEDSTLVEEGETETASRAGGDENPGPKRAWSRLFDILDRDGDGHITHADFQRAPVAACAVSAVLQSRLEAEQHRAELAQPVLSGQKVLSGTPSVTSFGTVVNVVDGPVAGGPQMQEPAAGRPMPSGPMPPQLPGMMLQQQQQQQMQQMQQQMQPQQQQLPSPTLAGQRQMSSALLRQRPPAPAGAQALPAGARSPMAASPGVPLPAVGSMVGPAVLMYPPEPVATPRGSH